MGERRQYQNHVVGQVVLWLIVGFFAGSASGAGTDLPKPRSTDILPPFSLTSIAGVDSEQISCFMGGASNGEILGAEALAARFARPTEYRLYNLDGAGAVVVAPAPPVNEGSDGECADLWRHEMAMDPRSAGKFFAALHSGRTGPGILPASPLPKILQSLESPRAEHIVLVEKFLSRRNIAAPEVKIIQTVRTDLDGDGIDDWVINAVRHKPDIARKGDYSIVLVLRGQKNGTRTYIVQDEITLEDSPYPSTLWVNKIVAIVDVDGDGSMEIILTGNYVYGGGWELIRFVDGAFEHVLFCGCDG